MNAYERCHEVVFYVRALITARFIADITGLKRTTVMRKLNVMQETGLIKRSWRIKSGPDVGTVYETR